MPRPSEIFYGKITYRSLMEYLGAIEIIFAIFLAFSSASYYVLSDYVEVPEDMNRDREFSTIPI